MLFAAADFLRLFIAKSLELNVSAAINCAWLDWHFADNHANPLDLSPRQPAEETLNSNQFAWGKLQLNLHISSSSLLISLFLSSQFTVWCFCFHKLNEVIQRRTVNVKKINNCARERSVKDLKKREVKFETLNILQGVWFRIISAKTMSYFTKLMRIPSHNFDPPPQKQRSRSLDVEALERSGIKMLRVVMTCRIFSLTSKHY